MKQIRIADTTLCKENSRFSFKEKLEIARQLEKLSVDIIELPEIINERTDILFVRTVASFVKKSVISVAAGSTLESIDNAAQALSNANKPCIRVELPVSPALMEYTCHKKANKMIAHIKECITKAKSYCENVEFCAVDATRAEKDFLKDAIKAARESGATAISICDSASSMMPDDFAEFAEKIGKKADVPMGVKCDNKNGLATASSILSCRKGVDVVKTAVDGDCAPLDEFVTMIKNCGDNYGFESNIRFTEMHRIIKQINRIAENANNENTAVSVAGADENSIHLDAKDSADDVAVAVKKLGYDLSEEDDAKVYEEFLRVAEKKNVGAKELDAIVASVALQVPATYKLISYIVNSGNIINSSAQITLEKDGEQLQGICIGDGPVDAAFLAIDQIIGHHYELDDFQIQSVTQGKEAMGSAIVKLRNGSRVFSGNGISTDIIGASIRAYLNAVNKIVYEEA
ncbi:MAG: hypothetical protein E7513_03150 [Ruminococcaceae bacterium]|nr:hypothetical protein [Oscillospiraceae bacterium]